MRPLAIDLFCGLGGWTKGLLAAGYDVVGFDIERHDYGTGGYPGQLVIQDVLTLHGSQFRNAALIVASPPCQAYSYMAMPWTRAKALAAWYRDPEGQPHRIRELTALFDACSRIQRQASEAAGRYIPLVVENVKGAQPWVGRAQWHYGSFYLWGDVPALMPHARSVLRAEAIKNNGGSWFAIGSPGHANVGQNPGGRKLPAGHDTFAKDGRKCNKLVDPRYGSDGLKNERNWWSDGAGSLSATTSSKSSARKAASAQIAKIPFPLAYHIARTYLP